MKSCTDYNATEWFLPHHNTWHIIMRLCYLVQSHQVAQPPALPIRQLTWDDCAWRLRRCVLRLWFWEVAHVTQYNPPYSQTCLEENETGNELWKKMKTPWRFFPLCSLTSASPSSSWGRRGFLSLWAMCLWLALSWKWRMLNLYNENSSLSSSKSSSSSFVNGAGSGSVEGGRLISSTGSGVLLFFLTLFYKELVSESQSVTWVHKIKCKQLASTTKISDLRFIWFWCFLYDLFYRRRCRLEIIRVHLWILSNEWLRLLISFDQLWFGENFQSLFKIQGDFFFPLFRHA